MITFDNYALDNRIDERIDDALNFGDVYGGDLFDDDGKVRTLEDIKIGFQPGHLIDIIQRQQEQITDLEYNSAVLWTDVQGYKDECRGLTASDGVNSNAIEMLLERVKVLEKEVEKL